MQGLGMGMNGEKSMLEMKPDKMMASPLAVQKRGDGSIEAAMKAARPASPIVPMAPTPMATERRREGGAQQPSAPSAAIPQWIANLPGSVNKSRLMRYATANPGMYDTKPAPAVPPQGANWRAPQGGNFTGLMQDRMNEIDRRMIQQGRMR